MGRARSRGSLCRRLGCRSSRWCHAGCAVHPRTHVPTYPPRRRAWGAAAAATAAKAAASPLTVEGFMPVFSFDAHRGHVAPCAVQARDHSSPATTDRRRPRSTCAGAGWTWEHGPRRVETTRSSLKSDPCLQRLSTRYAPLRGPLGPPVVSPLGDPVPAAARWIGPGQPCAPPRPRRLCVRHRRPQNDQ